MGDTVPEELKSNTSEGKATRSAGYNAEVEEHPDTSVLHLAQTPECWTLLQTALGHALIGILVSSMAAVTATSCRKPTINPSDFCIKAP